MSFFSAFELAFFFYLFLVPFFFVYKSFRLLYKSFGSLDGIPLKRLLRNSLRGFMDVLEVFKLPSVLFSKYSYSVLLHNFPLCY